jgi:hypothetical protein
MTREHEIIQENKRKSGKGNTVDSRTILEKGSKERRMITTDQIRTYGKEKDRARA